MSEPLLLVEDEPQLQRLMMSVLHAVGYAVLAASTVAEARTHVGRRFAGLVVDHRLPNGYGHEVEAMFPGVPALHISGFIGDTPAEWPVQLAKPFTGEEFLEAVSHLVGPPERA